MKSFLFSLAVMSWLLCGIPATHAQTSEETPLTETVFESSFVGSSEARTPSASSPLYVRVSLRRPDAVIFDLGTEMQPATDVPVRVITETPYIQQGERKSKNITVQPDIFKTGLTLKIRATRTIASDDAPCVSIELNGDVTSLVALREVTSNGMVIEVPDLSVLPIQETLCVQEAQKTEVPLKEGYVLTVTATSV